ncbi:Transmembrane osmosensor [Recurvomyces mirabilis]|nr:Transmembrane osmosensor [Recurvomyces mirabilis]
MPWYNPSGQLPSSKIDWASFPSSKQTTMAELWPTPEMSTAELMRFAAESMLPALDREQERRRTTNNRTLEVERVTNIRGDSIAAQPKKPQTGTPGRQAVPSAGTSIPPRCVRPLTVIVTAIADTLPPLMPTPINDWSRELGQSLVAVKSTEHAAQLRPKSPRLEFAPARISLRRCMSQKSYRSPTTKTEADFSSPGICNLTRAGNNRKRMSPSQFAERTRSGDAQTASTDDPMRLDSNGERYRQPSSTDHGCPQQIGVLDWAYRRTEPKGTAADPVPCHRVTIDSAMTDLERESCPFIAIATENYAADQDEPNQLSFQQGEVLEVANASSPCWLARKRSQVGIVPSKSLQLVSNSARSTPLPAVAIGPVDIAVVGVTAGPGTRLGDRWRSTRLGPAVFMDS